MVPKSPVATLKSRAAIPKRKAGPIDREDERQRRLAIWRRWNNQHKQSSRPATIARSTLADLGITKNQSSKWQKLAGIPEEQFEGSLAADKPTTTNGLLAATAGLNHGRRSRS